MKAKLKDWINEVYEIFYFEKENNPIAKLKINLAIDGLKIEEFEQFEENFTFSINGNWLNIEIYYK